MARLLFLLLLALPLMASALPCGHIGPSDEGPQTLAAHRCLSLSFGKKSVNEHTLTYKGALIGLIHLSMDEEDIRRPFIPETCSIDGFSFQLLTQGSVGTLSGMTMTGLMSHATHHRGVQLSGLANRVQTLSGVQLALALNRAEERASGLQLGLINVAKELKGVQLGLLNFNAAGWCFPLLNISW